MLAFDIIIALLWKEIQTTQKQLLKNGFLAGFKKNVYACPDSLARIDLSLCQEVSVLIEFAWL